MSLTLCNHWGWHWQAVAMRVYNIISSFLVVNETRGNYRLSHQQSTWEEEQEARHVKFLLFWRAWLLLSGGELVHV